jgi:hypothetical protein
MFHCKCNRQTYVKGDWCCVIEQKKALALKLKARRELEQLYQKCGLSKEQIQTAPTNA